MLSSTACYILIHISNSPLANEIMRNAYKWAIRFLYNLFSPYWTFVKALPLPALPPQVHFTPRILKKKQTWIFVQIVSKTYLRNIWDKYSLKCITIIIITIFLGVPQWCKFHGLGYLWCEPNIYGQRLYLEAFKMADTRNWWRLQH